MKYEMIFKLNGELAGQCDFTTTPPMYSCGDTLELCGTDNIDYSLSYIIEIVSFEKDIIDIKKQLFTRVYNVIQS